MKQLLIMVFSLFLLACNSKDIEKTCDVKDPVDELVWLSDYIQRYDTSTYTYITISLAILKDLSTKDKTDGILIHLTSRENTAEYEQYYFNCEGDEICREFLGVIGASCTSYDIIESKVIYKNY